MASQLEQRVLRARAQALRWARRELSLSSGGRLGRAVHVWRGLPLIYRATLYLGPGGQIDVVSDTWVIDCFISSHPAPQRPAAIWTQEGGRP